MKKGDLVMLVKNENMQTEEEHLSVGKVVDCYRHPELCRRFANQLIEKGMLDSWNDFIFVKWLESKRFGFYFKSRLAQVSNLAKYSKKFIRGKQ